MNTPDVLAHRLNFDAIVLCGCTMKELQIIALVSLVIAMLLLGVLMKLLIGYCLVGVGLAFPTTVGMTWAVAQVLQRAKQGKPQGYVKQRFLLWCDDHYCLPALYIRRHGPWSVGRSC